MKPPFILFLAALTIAALLLIIAGQGAAIELQRKLIREMATNPYCMGLK